MLAGAPAARKFDESDYLRYGTELPQYMVDRGFTTETLEEFGVRDDGRNWRVVIPIRGWEGEVVGVSKRLYWDRDWCFRCKEQLNGEKRCPGCDTSYSKYMHSRGMNRNSLVYGAHLYRPGSVPVILEGFTDTMRLHQNGLDDEVATPMAIMGANAGGRQMLELVKFTGSDCFVLAGDGDEAGLDMMEDASRALLDVDADLRVGKIVVAWGTDPGDASMDEVALMREWLEWFRVHGKTGDDLVLHAV